MMEPSIAYMIGEKNLSEDTSYVSCVLNKKGDFIIQGGRIRLHMRRMKALQTGSIICICLIIISESARQTGL